MMLRVAIMMTLFGLGLGFAGCVHAKTRLEGSSTVGAPSAVSSSAAPAASPFASASAAPVMP